jgi:hypothetical protein
VQPKWVQVDWCHARDHCYLIIRAWDHSLLTAGLAAPRGKRQVIRTTRLLERLPAAACGALTQHLLAAAAAEHATLVARSQADRSASVAELEAHKRSLHPDMLYPSRREGLEALRAAEGARQRAAAQLATRYAGEAAATAAARAQEMRLAAQALVKLLLQLLDGFVMPGDLPLLQGSVGAETSSAGASSSGSSKGGVWGAAAAAAEQELWVGGGLARRDLRQLERLALAQQEVPPAEVVGAQPAAAAATLGAMAAPTAAGAASHQGGKTASGPQPRPITTKGGASGGAAVPTKPGSPAAAADKAARATAPTAPKAPTGRTGAGVEAGEGHHHQQQPVTGRPSFAQGTWLLPAGNLHLAGLGWADASGASSNSCSQQPGKAGEPAAAAPGEAAGGCTVTAVDTPCHRACVRAYLAALRQLEGRMAAAVADHRARAAAWEEHELRWRAAWERMMQELDTI